MARLYSTGERPAARHFAEIATVVLRGVDFGIAANSPDPRVRAAAEERLRQAGFPDATIQAYINNYRNAAKLRACGRMTDLY